jgi:uncharacterized protein
VIALDTSGLFALLNRADPDHEPVKGVLKEDPGPYLVPAGILAEVAYLVERRLGTEVLEAFVLDLEGGGFSLHCGEEDLAASVSWYVATTTCLWASPMRAS